MSRFSSYCALSVTALAVTSAPAFADVTAQEVWENWRATAGIYGQTLSAESEVMDGDTLVISGITISMDLPDGALVATLGEVRLEEIGDGSVAISADPTYPIRISSTGSDGEDVDITVMVSQEDMSLVASGDSSAISYAYLLPEVSISMEQMLIDGEPFDMDFEVSALETSGTYLFANTDPRQIDSSMTASAMAFRMHVVDPENAASNFDMTMSMTDLRSDSRGSMSPFGTTEILSELLDRGLSTTGSVEYGPTTFSFGGSDKTSTFRMDGSIESGEYSGTLNSDGLNYGGGNEGLNLSVSGSDIPFPSLAVAIARTSGRLAMPLTPSDEPRHIALVSRIEGLTVDEILWSLFDPQALLPRDPATVIIDVSGQANWLVDITDPEQAAALESAGVMPGQLHSLALNQFVLSLLGAELTGTGDMAFENSAGPVPQPTGTVEFSLAGGNALLDTLVSMGLVPEDQAMGARMMLGLFARQVEGEDRLNSTIEFKEDGSILANGQRIR